MSDSFFHKDEVSAKLGQLQFSTVANEAGKNSDVIERQLAHVERNETRAAYHRAAYLKERAALMQWWADWLDAHKGARVLPFKAA